MKLPVSKSTAIAGGGVLLVAGVILAAERGGWVGKRGQPRDGSAAGPSSKRSDKPQTCPTEATVEDPKLVVDPEFIKTRFTTNTCWRTAAGDINSCLDPDEAACEKRLTGMRRLVGKSGECAPRPKELFCSIHVSVHERAATICFETKAACDALIEKKKKQPARVCRIVPACERVALPPV